MLNTVVNGTGAPGIILVPPNPFDLTYWSAQQARYSAWFRCLSVDLPGYGFSEPLSQPTTLEEIAQAIWSAADTAGLDRVAVIGASMGSTLALHMHAQQSERVAALVLTACSYRPVKAYADVRISGYRSEGIDYRRRHIEDGFSAGFRESAEGRRLIRLALERNHLVDVESVIRLFEAHRIPDPDWLFDVSCPTLIASGTEDYAHDGALALSAKIPGASFVPLEGVGHSASQERPYIFDEVVLAFLRQSLNPVGLVSDPPTVAGDSADR
jgi:3-oxoadipate enol-lactonase